MFETSLLIAQAALTASLAAWLFAGVRDNYLYPDMNREAVRMILQFDLMQADWPDEYAHVRHRRVEDLGLIRLAFRAIVIWETLACGLLVVGLVALLMALFGTADPATARALALIGATAFTVTWADFLLGGNHYCIWYSHQGSQHTHFALAIWGTLAMIFMALPL